MTSKSALLLTPWKWKSCSRSSFHEPIALSTSDVTTSARALFQIWNSSRLFVSFFLFFFFNMASSNASTSYEQSRWIFDSLALFELIPWRWVLLPGCPRCSCIWLLTRRLPRSLGLYGGDSRWRQLLQLSCNHVSLTLSRMCQAPAAAKADAPVRPSLTVLSCRPPIAHFTDVPSKVTPKQAPPVTATHNFLFTPPPPQSYFAHCRTVPRDRCLLQSCHTHF